MTLKLVKHHSYRSSKQSNEKLQRVKTTELDDYLNLVFCSTPVEELSVRRNSNKCRQSWVLSVRGIFLFFDILFNEGAIFVKLMSLAVIIQTVAVVFWDPTQ